MLKYTEQKEVKLFNLSPANFLPTLNNPARTVMFKRSTTLTVWTHLSTEQKQNRVVVQIFTCGFTKHLSNHIQGHAG